jgi:hypothetical protein
MDVSKIRAKLSEMDRQRRLLEEKIKVAQRKELLALPGQMGLESVDALILALLEHASPGLRARCLPDARLPDNRANREASARVRFSEELRAQVRSELEAGLKSVAELSREYGPSHPTIMGWKRAWGMTHPRSRKKNANGGG